MPKIEEIESTNSFRSYMQTWRWLSNIISSHSKMSSFEIVSENLSRAYMQ